MEKELFYVNLEPTVGAEISKTRPCIVISPDEMNNNLRTVIVSPLTTKFRDIPSRIKIKANSASGLKEDSYAALDQIKAIDKKRLGDRIGIISSQEASLITEFLCEMFQS